MHTDVFFSLPLLLTIKAKMKRDVRRSDQQQGIHVTWRLKVCAENQLIFLRLKEAKFHLALAIKNRPMMQADVICTSLLLQRRMQPQIPGEEHSSTQSQIKSTKLYLQVKQLVFVQAAEPEPAVRTYSDSPNILFSKAIRCPPQLTCCNAFDLWLHSLQAETAPPGCKVLRVFWLITVGAAVTLHGSNLWSMHTNNINLAPNRTILAV